MENTDDIKFYFAPLEGITGYIYRNAFHETFGGVDKYFIPFLSPGAKKKLTEKERNDILPEHNARMCAVPQILSKNAADVVNACEMLKSLGYEEVNLNLGCPSKTVVSKGKGSGFLADTEKLDRFFDEVFSVIGAASSKTEPGTPQNIYPRISVKTRLGMDSVEEFADILKVYNRYPLSELIIHARVQKEFYKGEPHLETFADVVNETKHSLCYNGDIWTLQDYIRMRKLFPTITKVMIGRGMMANPELIQELNAYEECRKQGKPWEGYVNSMEQLKKFHDSLLEGYMQQMSGDENNVLFKMKELWGFLGRQFQEQDKTVKKLVKTTRLKDYEGLAERIFSEK